MPPLYLLGKTNQYIGKEITPNVVKLSIREPETFALTQIAIMKLQSYIDSSSGCAMTSKTFLLLEPAPAIQ